MIAKIFVNKNFVKDISLPEDIASSKNTLFPYFDQQKIKDKVRDTVGTTPGFVQIYLPDFNILIID